MVDSVAAARRSGHVSTASPWAGLYAAHRPYIPGMPTEALRAAAAAQLRALAHSFAEHDTDDEVLTEIADTAAALERRVGAAPMRNRLQLMRTGIEESLMGLGFEDRAVGGRSNPTAAELDVRYDTAQTEGGTEGEIIADVVLRRAFEGAPGRAHGGIVAAAFDDVTGFVIAQLQEPAFTGELTVRYLAPVPVDERLEIRARLDRRERRKLFISGEVRAHDEVLATCRAIYITVDPSVFAQAPDPR
jgi:acyl-coenzyme A thioesterase PaaI-like protein